MVSVSRHGATRAGSGSDAPHDRDDDNRDENRDDDDNAFGDSGRFGVVSEVRREIHWPTVLVAGSVAAVVSSLILTLGVVGFHRSADRPTEIVVAVDPRGAVSVDGMPVVDGQASSSSPSSSSAASESAATAAAAAAADPSGTTAADPSASAVPGDGGGLSPATGAPATTAPAPTGTSAPDGDPAARTAPGDEPAVDEPGRESRAPRQEPADETPERVTGWSPPAPLPADFAVTTSDPTLDDLNAIVHLLVATPASDQSKARNLEAGAGGVVVPQTIYNLGVFRAPQGWKRITGPVERSGESITATLHSESAGRPSITTRVVFVLHDGNWKLSTRSVCEGVRTVGLPVSCGG